MRNLRIPTANPSSAARLEPDIANLTIEDIQAGYESGALSPSDVASACLGRIARLEPLLNAFILYRGAAARSRW